MVGIIVARSKNNVIGKDGKIPWRIRGEQAQFRELTTGNAILMGRKTYEDIGGALSHRLTVVVTSSDSIGEVDSGDTQLTTARSIEEAIRIAKNRGYENIYVAGGYGLFKEAIEKDLVDSIFLTEVDLVVDGENLVTFPSFDEEKFDIKPVEEVLSVNEKDEQVWFSRFEYVRNREKEEVREER